MTEQLERLENRLAFAIRFPQVCSKMSVKLLRIRITKLKNKMEKDGKE